MRVKMMISVEETEAAVHVVASGPKDLTTLKSTNFPKLKKSSVFLTTQAENN